MQLPDSLCTDSFIFAFVRFLPRSHLIYGAFFAHLQMDGNNLIRIEIKFSTLGFNAGFLVLLRRWRWYCRSYITKQIYTKKWAESINERNMYSIPDIEPLYRFHSRLGFTYQNSMKYVVKSSRLRRPTLIIFIFRSNTTHHGNTPIISYRKKNAT